MRTSTKAFLLIILTQLATIGVFMCINLASMWLEVSHGLNPWIALPVGTCLALIPYVVHSLWFDSDSPNDNYDTIDINPASHAKREPYDH
jgi:hypothetical protein